MTRLHLALAASTALVSPAFAQDADTITLDQITLYGASYQTEGTDSWSTDLISVGEKATMSPREVPQSTSVVTRKQIEDGGYTALETALDNTPGLLILNNDVGRSSIFSRGFEFDYLYYDGLPAPVSSIYGTQPDLSIMDHVEVLKGPSGLFIGTGSPAGAINMRLKQANADTPRGYATATADSNGHARVELDYGAPLNADASLRGRTVLAYAGGDGSVDKQTNGVRQFYGALAWDATPDTTATLSFSHMQRDIAPFNGLPTYADGSLIWTDPSATTAADWNDFDNKVDDLVAGVEHHFGNGARAKFSLRKSRQSGDFTYAFAGSPAAPDNSISALAWISRDFSHDNLALDAHAELPFTVAGIEGMAIIGADMQKTDSRVAGVAGRIPGSWNLDNWDVSDVARPDVTYGNPDRTETDSKGIYAQLRVKPAAGLTLLGGARLSWQRIDALSSAGVSSTIRENAHLTPYAGITWDVRPDTTIYASYTEIFQPQDALGQNGELLAPLEGRQFELGAKAQLAGGLDVSAALFRLDQVNRAQSVPGETWSVAKGKVRVQGFEAEAAGEMGDNWHVAAGYTYTDSEYLNGDNEGAVFSTYTPRHMLKLAVAYDVTDGPVAGWTFGAQFRAVSSFSSVSRGTEITAPGYGVVDMSARRAIGQGADLTLSVSNLLDKNYYTRVGGTPVFNFRGEPRKIGFSLNKRF